MKTKVIYAFHILLVLALAWGLGYSVARGQNAAHHPLSRRRKRR
jgi:hypothetical protein